MVSPIELDIFTRSLGGDRRARTELYKKYLQSSSRVCRLGSGHPDLNDFLHDCFSNLLRTGYAWDKETGLSDWVESVAVWTALMTERQRDMGARGAKGAIRMCAEVEGDKREVLSSYAPPQGAEDSPASLILALLGEPEMTVFRTRALEKRSWEETSAAASRPINAVGPAFARAVSRLARLFGAPPPIDDDLEPVFARAAADPLKPEGRAISMQLDNAFYTITPEMQKVGLTTSYDARTVMLWNTAASATPPADALRKHLDDCHYCTDLLRALILMQQALLCGPGVEFHLCPGSFTLSNSLDLARDAFDQHLAQCSICREERTQVLEGQAPKLAEGEDAAASAGAGKRLLWASAALVVVAAASFGGYRYFAGTRAAPPPVETSAVAKNENLTPTVSIDRRYRKLVKDIPFDRDRIMASVRPENRAVARYAADQFSLGQISLALTVSSQFMAKRQDPGMQMIYAMCLYNSHLPTDGYREMLRSEAMSPRETYRCWVLFEFALMVGDRAVLDREAEHLSADPKYRDTVNKTMEQVRAVG
jgi:DNA-directed RNA polymerase specialized sigma24 family protein